MAKARALLTQHFSINPRQIRDVIIPENRDELVRALTEHVICARPPGGDPKKFAKIVALDFEGRSAQRMRPESAYNKLHESNWYERYQKNNSPIEEVEEEGLRDYFPNDRATGPTHETHGREDQWYINWSDQDKVDFGYVPRQMMCNAPAHHLIIAAPGTGKIIIVEIKHLMVPSTWYKSAEFAKSKKRDADGHRTYVDQTNDRGEIAYEATHRSRRQLPADGGGQHVRPRQRSQHL